MTYVSEDYIKAYKMGKKDYQARMMRGEVPTLKVLDDILPSRGSYSEVPLGLVQIPDRPDRWNKDRWQKQRVFRKFHADPQRKYGICLQMECT